MRSAQQVAEQRATAQLKDAQVGALAALKLADSMKTNGEEWEKGQRRAREILSESAQVSAKANLADWMNLFWKLVAKYKDGQRLDDLHAETLSPTRLWYPVSWLKTAGFFNPSIPPWGARVEPPPPLGSSATEAAAAPLRGGAPSGSSWFVSHLATLAVGALLGRIFFASSGDPKTQRSASSVRGLASWSPWLKDKAATTTGYASIEDPGTVPKVAIDFINDFEPEATARPTKPASPRAVRALV